jgi:hypothetical protein
MVLIPYTVLLGAALLSVKAQITSAPGPAATSAAGAGPEPLTQYHFTYPNVVRLHPHNTEACPC